MTIVTRFPPSPTGFMHIGNARTALFNWLYARAKGGKFLVRIEDTDRKRHNEEAVQVILDGLKWLELDHDGEITSQFANQARHVEVAEQLLAEGKAYKCYCTPEELDEMRAQARESSAKVFYDRRWRDKSASEAPEGVQPVVRIKAPLEGATTIEDEVQGSVTINHDQLDDFIILRADGSPTYMLSVVVDDHDMGVTHIIRGDDHLNNAFRQHVIFESMGWKIPTFAHLPLIHGTDGAKFSKRHGAQSVEEFREMGYLAAAMRNYLMRLGWGHGDDEIISTEQALEWFDLSGVGKAAAKFDFDKLDNLNAHYIGQGSAEELIGAASEHFSSVPDETTRTRIAEGLEELQKRSKTLIEFAHEAAFYAPDMPQNYDEKASGLLDEAGCAALSKLHDAFKGTDALTGEAVQGLCKAVADEIADGKLGKVAMPLRAAVTGKTSSPSIFHACAIIGAEETCERIQRAIKKFAA